MKRYEAGGGRARNEKTTWEADEKERRLQNFLKDNPNMPRPEAYQKFRNQEGEACEETDDKHAKEYAKMIAERNAEQFLSELESFLRSSSSQNCWDNGYVTRLVTPDYVKEAVDQSLDAKRIIMTTFKNPNSMDKQKWEPQLQEIKELKKKIANGWNSNPQNKCSEERKEVLQIQIELAKLFEFGEYQISPQSQEAREFYKKYGEKKEQMQI